MAKAEKNETIKVENLETKILIPYARNARTHSDAQIKQIAGSIREFGFTNPVLIDHENGVIAGHGRILAAELIDMKKIPCIRLEHLTETQKKAYIIADNKLALNAGWDEDILSIELQEILDTGFDIDLIGFDQKELDELLQTTNDGLTDEDDVPDVPDDPVVQLGDIHILGDHRLMCGDSTVKETVDILMDGEKADLFHTDPPYNVDYSNADRPKASKTDLGKIKNDKMSPEKFYEFLFRSLTCGFDAMKQDSSCYIWHASAEQVNFTNALINSGFKYTQQIIWKKPMLLGRGRYQWAHEPCLMGTKGKPYFTDDRTKTTIWDFGGYDKSKNVHPTQKPVFIPEEAINNSSKSGSIVLDLFGGSGSTMIACEKTDRQCYMMELDPHYCDVIIKRWENFTGKKAVKHG